MKQTISANSRRAGKTTAFLSLNKKAKEKGLKVQTRKPIIPAYRSNPVLIMKPKGLTTMTKPTIRANMKKIGKALRAYRNVKGISQQKLADQVKASQSTIARIEVGTSMPKLETLYQLCEALGCSITQFFLETERQA